MSVSKTSKLLQYINYRMRVTVTDGRQMVGRFMAFDRHMNLVLGDAEEYRKLPPKKGRSEEELEAETKIFDAEVFAQQVSAEKGGECRTYLGNCHIPINAQREIGQWVALHLRSI